MQTYTPPSDLGYCLKSMEFVFVQFSADWCGPCQGTAPLVDRVASEYADRVGFLKLDLDACGAIAADHAVTSIPAFLLFKNGVAVDRFAGLRTLSRFCAFLDKHLEAA